MFRSRSWFGGNWGRPKNPHSLEKLKYLHNILAKNTTVSENNRGTLVESLRLIAEILIWGDQNDGTVFDFFLEKNMLSYFLKIMRQKCGGSSFVCIQLLQTLNILFENIRNETSLYYLLSNNHVNSIIVHKFDFSDEEVMAYYISFLKTLSLKLNSNTIHFFYNEHTKDFPLYTEAIKFFHHSESMVRIAVRTLTLNVYRVQDASMLRFIRDRTAAPYFSNLVWFIGKHILELDACVRNTSDHLSQKKLDDIVAEHLDHLHYINDILCLNIPDLNDVLTEHLLHKLLIPLYIYSLISPPARLAGPSSSYPYNKDHLQSIEAITRNLEAILKGKSGELSPTGMQFARHRVDQFVEDDKPCVSCVVSLFLLSQVFLIITHGPIIHSLAWIILQSDMSVFEEGATKILEMYINHASSSVKLEFSKPQLSLEKALDSSSGFNRDYTTPEYTAPKSSFGFDADTDQSSCDLDPELVSTSLSSTAHASCASSVANDSTEDLLTQVFAAPVSVLKSPAQNMPDSPLPDQGEAGSFSKPRIEFHNITDEEKEKLLNTKVPVVTTNVQPTIPLEKILEKKQKELENLPFLKIVIDSLDCSENDYKALFALCLLFALINNKGVNTELLDILLCSELEATSSSKPEENSQNDEQASSPEKPKQRLNALVVSKLMSIINLSCKPASKVRLVTLELATSLLAASAGGAAPRLLPRAEALRARAAALARTFYSSDDIFLDMFEDEYYEMTKRPLNVEWLCMDAAILLPPTRTPMSGVAFAKRLPSGETERARRGVRAFLLVRTLWLRLARRRDTQLPLALPAPYVQPGDVLDLNDSDLISCDIIQKDGSWQHRFLVVDSVQVILVEPDRARLGWGVATLVGALQDLEIQGDKEDPRCLHLTIYKPRVGGGAIPRTVLLRAKFKFDDHIRSMAAKQRLTKGRTKARQKKMQQIGRLLEVAGAVAACSGTATTTRARPLFTAGRPGKPAPRRDLGDKDDPERRIRRPSGHMMKDGIVVYRERTASRDRELEPKGISQLVDSFCHRAKINNASSRSSSPRPEHIPLEDLRRNAAPPVVPEQVQPTTSAAVPKVPPKSSAETSFISADQQPLKRKGAVETI